jgi:hypothetical protein
MSHSAETVSSHRLHPTKDLTPRVHEWEVHIGMTGFLYVVGPGPSAMVRAYRSATDPHLALVRRAVLLLNRTRREDADAGPAEIRAALVKVGWRDDD